MVVKKMGTANISIGLTTQMMSAPTREMRCLRHKIHMGLFCTFGLSALNWILTLSWKNLVPPDLAEPLLCTTFTLTYFFHLTSFYWMFLEGFYLFLQVFWWGNIDIVSLNHLIMDDPLQVQFPLSLVSIKYKHFLIFGLGVPLANTLLWLILRLHQQVVNSSKTFRVFIFSLTRMTQTVMKASTASSWRRRRLRPGRCKLQCWSSSSSTHSSLFGSSQ